MATQRNQILSTEGRTQGSSGGRMLYPMTEEIYERGEKLFWETFERLQREDQQKNQKEDPEDI